MSFCWFNLLLCTALIYFWKHGKLLRKYFIDVQAPCILPDSEFLVIMQSNSLSIVWTCSHLLSNWDPKMIMMIAINAEYRCFRWSAFYLCISLFHLTFIYIWLDLFSTFWNAADCVLMFRSTRVLNAVSFPFMFFFFRLLSFVWDYATAKNTIS